MARELQKTTVSRDYVDNVIGSMLDALIVIDPNARIRTVNRATCELLGYEQKELIGMPAGNIFVLHEGETLLNKTLLDELAKEGEIRNYETEYKAKDGRRIPVLSNYSAIKDEDGKVLHIVCTARDITQRKRAEEALRESENKYRTLLENLPQKIFLKDRNSVYVSCNENYARDLKVRPDEIAGKTDYHFFPKELAEKYRGDDKRVMEMGKTEDIEERYIQDGREVIVHTVKTPVKHEQGNVIGLLGIFWDITERKKTEEELVRLSSAVKMTRDSIVVSDLEGKILDANEATLQMYGTDSREDLVGKDSFALIAPEERERAVAGMQEVIEKGYIQGREYHIATKDSRRIPVEMNVTLMKDQNGRPVGFVAVSRDITEHKQAELKLRESEERYRTIFEAANDILLLIDRKGKILDINEKLTEIAGYKPEELVGKSIRSLSKIMTKKSLAIVVKNFLKRIAGMDIAPYEVQMVRKNGELADIEISAVAILKNGQIVGDLAILRDITERKRAEQALKEYSEKLEEMVQERTGELKKAQEQLLRKERLAVLGHLAGGVGHELRNPLGVISNAMYFLRMTLRDSDETTKEYLDIISSEVGNAEKIVSDLLDFSRTRQPERKEVAASDVVAQVLEKQAPPDGVKVTTNIAPDLPLLFIDPGQIGQVLVNLVTNAYQAMPDGGKLTISARIKEGMMHLSVSDTGCGISKENMKRVFEPLFTTKAKGVGLGLAVSKTLVEANSGSIKVESKEGKGTTFTLTLPVQGQGRLGESVTG